MNDSSLQFNRRDFQSLSIGALLMSMAGTNLAAEKMAPKVEASLRTANNDFAWDFFRTIEALKPGSNHFVSPFSIESALLMTLEGARNKTAQEMGQTLRLPGNFARPNASQHWDLGAIRQEVSSLLDRFKPQPVNVITQKRQQLEKLRSELEDQSRNVQKLVQAGKYDDANSLQAQSGTLVNNINALSETLDSVDLRLANGIWADKRSNFVAEFYRDRAEVLSCSGEQC